MTDKKLLVVYGTRYGSTEEIAQKIASIAENANISVSLIDLRKTQKKFWPSLEGFDGVIIGTGIRINRWVGQVKKFLVLRKEEINSFQGKIVFFTSSGLAFDKSKHDESVAVITNPMQNIGVSIPYYEIFGGKYDLTESSRFNFFDKWVIKMVAKDDPNIVFGETNDQRDWKQIEQFASSFTEYL